LSVQLALSHQNHLLGSDVEARVRRGVEEVLRGHARAVEEAQTSTSIAMAGGFAHEIGNALAPAKLALEVLGETELPHECREALAIAQQGIVRSLKVADVTLAYARAGEIKPGADTTAISAAVAAVLADLREELDRHRIAVEVDVDAQLHAIIKPEHIAIILRQLMTNACDAVRGGGVTKPCIWLRGAIHPRGVALTVRDNGRGMGAEQQQRLFQPFFSTKGAQGLGLGLGLSQRIIGAYGGQIEGQSAGEGLGASFTVVIPPLGTESGRPSGS
ncbi:MAG TPA: HAMP domain-containing sensor histidine kinase, partial [Myxococcota bacterium]|nr:HAMP domain-containing sensor histidine kinase [Myxococcota bacterium]